MGVCVFIGRDSESYWQRQGIYDQFVLKGRDEEQDSVCSYFFYCLKGDLEDWLGQVSFFLRFCMIFLCVFVMAFVLKRVFSV